MNWTVFWIFVATLLTLVAMISLGFDKSAMVAISGLATTTIAIMVGTSRKEH